MQRESQLTNEAERKLTQELANNIGKALEDISRASGSVAHMFKSLDMGTNGQTAKVHAKEWEPSFEKMIEECGTVKLAGAPATTTAPAATTASTASTVPQTTSTQIESNEEPLDQYLGIMQKEDFIKVLMNKTEELAHLPPKFYDTTKSLMTKTGSP